MPRHDFPIIDQGVHDHDVLVVKTQFPEDGKIRISPKLELCCINQVQIWNTICDINYVGIGHFRSKNEGGFVQEFRKF